MQTQIAFLLEASHRPGAFSALMRGFARLRPLALLTWLLLPAMIAPTKAAKAPAPEPIRQAVNRSLPLLQKSLAEYPHHATCFSCHHQGVGMFTLAWARARGYTVEKQRLADGVQHTLADLRHDLELYRKGEGQPGGVTRAGYALLALEAGGAKRSEITTAVTGYLLQQGQEQGYWSTSANRPPAEVSAFTDTFLALRALKTYGEETQKEAVQTRIERALRWLEQTSPKDTEDRVFQLWGLKEAGAEKAVLQNAAKALLAEQREDGGWAQLSGAKSDAYATGSALTVLTLAGGIAPDDSAYRRGVAFLLQTQQPDGSWHVVSRSKPFQPYFESGFPHRKDQFISMAASGWATTALALAERPRTTTEREPQKSERRRQGEPR